MNATPAIHVIFPVNQPDQPSWPYINYDVEGKREEVLAALRRRLPGMEFHGTLLRTAEEAESLVENEQGQYDGYLVYMTALWTGIGKVFARKARPVVIADDLYAGSGGILAVHTTIRNENLPVVTVASSNFDDVVSAVRLFEVMHRLRKARILVVRDTAGGMTDERERIEPLGTTRLQISAEQLLDYYNRADTAAAAEYQRGWMADAVKMVEPDADEILKSARMYLALKAAMKDHAADAVTVDCLGLYYAGKLPAYPCLGFFQLNNEGATGVCEADTDSTITQLMFRYLTGRPGYVSDPVIDTASNQIVYAHCVATNRVFGPDGLRNAYIIRSHAEDLKGASVQSLMPLGQPVTTAKFSPAKRCFAVHSGRAVANVNDDKGCRTKLAAEVNAQAILDNYRSDLFSWHRVTCYGDFRRDCLSLARLYDLEVHEEDIRQR